MFICKIELIDILNTTLSINLKLRVRNVGWKGYKALFVSCIIGIDYTVLKPKLSYLRTTLETTTSILKYASCIY